MTTARRRGLRVLHRCTKVNLAIGLRWIETRMASPARSSKAPSTPAVSNGVGVRVIHLLHVLRSQRPGVANEACRFGTAGGAMFEACDVCSHHAR